MASLRVCYCIFFDWSEQLPLLFGVDSQVQRIVTANVIVGLLGQLGHVPRPPVEVVIDHGLQHHAVVESLRGVVFRIVDRHQIATRLVVRHPVCAARAVRCIAEAAGAACVPRDEEITRKSWRARCVLTTHKQIILPAAHFQSGLRVVPPDPQPSPLHAASMGAEIIFSSQFTAPWGWQ